MMGATVELEDHYHFPLVMSVTEVANWDCLLAVMVGGSMD